MCFQFLLPLVHCEWFNMNNCFFTVAVPVAGDTQKSSSHFHCLKCDYYCTDTNKVVAHRRQHQKLDSIMAAGFEKYTPTQFCPVGGCPHNGKQTHYHCSKCQYAVLGLSQMEGHKYRHMNEWLVQTCPELSRPVNISSKTTQVSVIAAVNFCHKLCDKNCHKMCFVTKYVWHINLTII